MTTPGPAQRVDGGYPTRWATAAECVTEEQLMAFVIGVAKALHYRAYHTWSSVHSQAGYPDVTLLRTGPNPGDTRLIVVECKSSRGRVSPAQREWLEDFSKVPGVEVYVWRPEDIDDVEPILR